MTRRNRSNRNFADSHFEENQEAEEAAAGTHIPADAAAAAAGLNAVDVLAKVVEKMGGAPRLGQIDMCQEVAGALAGNRRLAVEAGTGVGKTFAYLVPAMIQSVATQSPVIVSTATLPLQRQIVELDAPRVAEVIAELTGYRPRVAILKGWNNYLCNYKLSNEDLAKEDQDELAADTGEEIFADGSLAEQMRKLRKWAKDTETGDRDELGVVDRRVWAAASIQKDRCQGNHCRFYNDCFPRRARVLANRADVVITNHTLLSISALSEATFLPESKMIIVDEAHRLADTMRNVGSYQISAKSIEKVAERIGKRRGSSGPDTGGAGKALEKARIDLENAGVALGRILEEAFESAAESEIQGWAKRKKIEPDSPGYKSAVKKAKSENSGFLLEPAAGDAQAGGTENVLGVLKRVLDQVANAAREGISKIDEAIKNKEEKLAGKESTGKRAKILLLRSELNELFEFAQIFNLESLRDWTQAAWVSKGKFGNSPVELNFVRLDVAEKLASQLWEERAAILASATLRVGGNFQTILKQTGLAGVNNESAHICSAKTVETPFDYPTHGVLYIPTDLEAPGSNWPSDQALEKMLEMVEASQGGALLLSTSIRGAEKIQEYLSENTDLPIELQQTGSVAAQVEAYRKNPRACLVGTMSLWQGIDVPGLTSRLVIIDKIPFPSPGDPLVKARMKRAGDRKFNEVYIPDGSFLLAQGAGRLLRTVDDKGVLAIFDSRLPISLERNVPSQARRAQLKNYSQSMKKALPDFWESSQETDAQRFEEVLGALRRIAAEAL